VTSLRTSAWEAKQSPFILDLCLRKTQAGKYHHHCNLLVFEMFSARTNSRKGGLFKFLRFEEHLLKAPFFVTGYNVVWTVGLIEEMVKLRFKISPAVCLGLKDIHSFYCRLLLPFCDG